MASLIGKLASFARTPAGQRALRTATAKAQELAKDPRTKERVTQVRERLQGQSASRSQPESRSPGEGSPGEGSPATVDPAPDDEQGRSDGQPARP